MSAHSPAPNAAPEYHDPAQGAANEEAPAPNAAPEYRPLPNSNRAIAAVLGVSERSIRRDRATLDDDDAVLRRVRGLDGKMYPPSEGEQKKAAGVAHELSARGWTQKRIADALGLSQPTVSRLLRNWRVVA